MHRGHFFHLWLLRLLCCDLLKIVLHTISVIFVCFKAPCSVIMSYFFTITIRLRKAHMLQCCLKSEIRCNSKTFSYISELRGVMEQSEHFHSSRYPPLCGINRGANMTGGREGVCFSMEGQGQGEDQVTWMCLLEGGKSTDHPTETPLLTHAAIHQRGRRAHATSKSCFSVSGATSEASIPLPFA